MPFVKISSIRRKQTLIIMLTSSVALVLACAAFIAYDWVTFRRELSESVTILADAIANNCAAAIDFNDPKSAEETLAALSADHNIVSASIYARDGRLFAVYRRDGASPLAPKGVQSAREEFTRDELHILRPIQQRGVMTGAIFVASDLKGLSSRLMRYGVIVGAVFLTSLLAALLLSMQLQRLVSDPILNLAQAARSVALEKNYSLRAKKQSEDELGQLVDGFNEMLGQIQTRDLALQKARDGLEKRVHERTVELENTHKLLVETSRRSGMAEIATNVLHNVGNALNSVNISTGLIVDSVKKSKASSLARVVVLLQKHEPDIGAFLTMDPRGKLLPTHLARLSEHLLAEHAEMTTELDLLRRNVEHIKEIVAMQQSYATVGGVKEMTDIPSLVEDSLRLNESGLSRHGVEIIRDFEKVPAINVEKHKILQILVNLIRNAKYACDETFRTDSRLTVRAANGDGRVRITVEDNGIGIPPENLTRIFNFGFTTRKGGHGFGLHSSALAARELGGSLTVHSDGTGRGAVFTLELPCLPQE